MAKGANIQSNTVGKLRQKLDSGSYETPTYLAAEPRFIKPIRGAGDQVKNFEEQYIMGVDTYTVKDQDKDGNDKIIRSFVQSRDNPISAEKFYRLETTIYKNPERLSGEGSFEFDDENHCLVMPNIAEISFENSILTCGSNNIFAFDDKIFRIFPNYDVKSQEEVLYFVKSNNPSENDIDKVKVLTKQTLTRYETRTKTIVKEVITRNEEG